MIFINATTTYENSSNVYRYGAAKEKEMHVKCQVPAYSESERITEKEIIADTLYSVFSKYAIKN
ncbi:MAG: hypothetical protein IJE14_05845 [Clostridia bacterium]|nr:hypothetical protein [Clostridia bacterium]